MMAGDRTYSCTYRTYNAQALSAPPSMSAIVSVTKWSQAAAARCLPFGTKVPAGPDWFHEIKHEGHRLIVQREGKRVRLLTRRGHDWSDRYPLIVKAALRLRKTSSASYGRGYSAHAPRRRRNGAWRASARRDV